MQSDEDYNQLAPHLQRVLEDPLSFAARINLAERLDGIGCHRRASLIRCGVTMISPTANKLELFRCRHIIRSYADWALKDWYVCVGHHASQSEIDCYDQKSLFAPPIPKTVVGDKKWRRWVWCGFLDQIEVTFSQFVEIARDLFSSIPVTKVRIIDVHRRANRDVPGFYDHGVDLKSYYIDGAGNLTWLSDHQGKLVALAMENISARIAKENFRTRRDARIAFSDACVDWGRALVGLPSIRRYEA